jgi:hypothetical protein
MDGCQGLSFELAQGSLDLCGIQFHRTLLRLGLRDRAFALPAKEPGVIARCGASHLEVVERFAAIRHPARTHGGHPRAPSSA